MPDFISAKALTLADYARQSKEPLIQKITWDFLGDFNVIEDLHLTTNKAMKMRGARYDGRNLEPTNYGKVNELPADRKSENTTFEESIFIIRERLQCDTRLLEAENWIGDPFDFQIKARMMAYRYDLNTDFFYNDPATAGGKPDAIIGLKARLTAADKDKYGVATGLNIDGGGIDLSPGGLSTVGNAAAELLVAKLMQAFAFLGTTDGADCVIYGNYVAQAQLAWALRNMKGFSTTKDSFDRTVNMLFNAKFKNPGFRRDQTSLVIPTTLNAAGDDVGNGNYTELYIVRYGGNYMKGWQTNALKPEYLGKSTEYGTYENVKIDWGMGIHYGSTRAMARIFNLKIS